LIYIVNDSGPRTDVWGTPAETMQSEEDELFIMLFSNTDIPEFNFTFNGSTIPITNSYKLLGVTFSSDAKCNIQVRLRSTSSL
jgi:hypothetical protein